MACLLAVTSLSVATGSAAAPKAAPESPLSDAGNQLLAKYAAMLKALQAEVTKTLPSVDEQNKISFQKAREAVSKALADADAAQQPLNTIQTAKALVDHAKGKWIGGAEKEIAQAEATLKKAATESEREAAKKVLASCQANKEAGVKALKDRQEALDKATTDEPKLKQDHQAAQAAMARARTNELMAAMVLLTQAEPFLSSDTLDVKLVSCAVLAAATPRGLAEFAQQGNEQEALVGKLLADTGLMKQMTVIGNRSPGGDIQIRLEPTCTDTKVENNDKKKGK